ncbi:MAG TPA: hypothetical protein VM802_20450 [Chitinophaga sp.]|uniref:hypothetical protein n=1 Tax=Chitinophaga sp. TaxID=1869181 RepID=UPI002D1A0F64|nr:hypothetical protein [Chitinophaga sp.]HVI47260.1 hypothetical protein [Chitinophaga sp.]
MTNNKDSISTAITPFLTVSNAEKAIAFYIKGLGATEVSRYQGTEGKVTAKLSIEGAEIWVGDEEKEYWRIGKLADPYGYIWETGRPLNGG